MLLRQKSQKNYNKPKSLNVLCIFLRRPRSRLWATCALHPIDETKQFCKTILLHADCKYAQQSRRKKLFVYSSLLSFPLVNSKSATEDDVTQCDDDGGRTSSSDYELLATACKLTAPCLFFVAHLSLILSLPHWMKTRELKRKRNPTYMNLYLIFARGNTIYTLLL